MKLAFDSLQKEHQWLTVTVFWNIKVPRRPHAQYKNFSCGGSGGTGCILWKQIQKYYFPYDNFNNYLIVPQAIIYWVVTPVSISGQELKNMLVILDVRIVV